MGDNTQQQTIAALHKRVVELEGALNALLNHYIEMALSGDCGFWDPETEDVVIRARAALKETAND